MGVQLRIAGRQLGEQLQNIVFVHTAVLQKAKGDFGVPDISALQRLARAAREAIVDKGVGNLVRKMAAGHPAAPGEAIAGEPEMVNAESFGILHEDLENDRMQMQVQVAVDVVERQAGGMKFDELRVDFGLEGFAQVAGEEVFHPHADGAVGKFAARIHKAQYFFGRQRAMAVQ